MQKHLRGTVTFTYRLVIVFGWDATSGRELSTERALFLMNNLEETFTVPCLDGHMLLE